MKILVLHNHVENSRKDDADTLRQVNEVSSCLEEQGHQIILGTVEQSLTDIEKHIQAIQPDLIFNLTESFLGSDYNTYIIPAYLEPLGIPFTGNSERASLLSGDKLLAKKIMKAYQIPTPHLSEDINENDTVSFIVKSVNEHASLGIDANSIVRGRKKAENLIKEKQSYYGGTWFAEQYIDGRECNVAIMGTPENPEIMPIAEIIFENYPENRPKIVDYEAKWDEQSYAYHHTPRHFLDEKENSLLLKKIKELTLLCWKHFHLEGYARVDFRIDHQNNPYVLEINTNPCLSSDAGFMATTAKAGFSYTDTINTIIEIALYDQNKEHTAKLHIG